MKRPPPIPYPRHRQRTRGARGFSLVELMVSSVLLVLALTGTSVLFIESNRSSAAATLRYRQQSLVDTDLARVRRLNDRYTCSSGTCSSLGTVELGKHDFFPQPINDNGTLNLTAGTPNVSSMLLTNVDSFLPTITNSREPTYTVALSDGLGAAFTGLSGSSRSRTSSYP